MNQIFQVSEQGIHIDSLTIESTLTCGRECSGCYLKNHSLQAEEVRPNQWYDLLFLFLSRDCKNYSTNQISISVNDQPDYGPWRTVDELLVLNHTLKENNEKKDTQVHLTMHSPATIGQYEYMFLEDFAAVDSIYFSYIPEEEVDIIKDLRELNAKIEIGWNCLLDNENKMADTAEVDTIYWVRDKSRPSLIPFLIPARKGLKKIEDTCWIDYNDWKRKNKTTCPANISKFTIWPDGSVSGCPYAKVSDTGPAGTYPGMLRNIVEASKKYNFDNCPMKEI